MGDAINTLMHLVLNHLDDYDAYARLLFIDFSSAFNTIQPRFNEKNKPVRRECCNHTVVLFLFIR